MPRCVYIGPVLGQDRPRFNRRTGRAYEKMKMKDAKTAIAKAWRDQVSGEPIGGPVSVYIDAYKPIPKSVKQEREWTVKPDADNIAKLVLDALNGIAFVDDANVVRLTIEKHRQERSTLEHIVVTVLEVD